MTQLDQTTESEKSPLSIDPSDFLDAKITEFSDINIHQGVIDAVNAMGWKSPTPVQGLCLPFTTKGRHVAGFAQTGTGKTGVFLITVISHILKQKEKKDTKSKGPKALILVPTRELAMQICHDAEEFIKNLDVSFLAVFGGIDYEKQSKQIERGVDVIVATPGRLKDFFKKGVVSLDSVEQFVCDEADRMFDMGFIEDIEFFMEKLKEDTQKLLFSATTNDQVKELAFEYLEKPEYIFVNPEVITPENIVQKTIICEAIHKVKVLIGLLREEAPTCAIIFTNTKIVADWLHYKMVKNGFEADVITGDLPQNKRIALIKKIKKGELKVLIATDVASRGLHISDVSHVVNFDLPDEPANYIHRIGRTARAGAKGTAYSLVCEDYGQNLEPISKLLGDIKLASIWHKEEYLKIEDKSGNPYDDPNFKGSHNKDTRAPAKTKDPAPRTSRQGAKHKEHANGQRPARKDARPERGPRKNDRKKPQQRSKYSNSKKKPFKDNRRYDKKAAAASKKAPEKVPQSISGMFKKIVGSLFGRKK